MNEAKFKVGDKVIILDGSKIEDYTGKWIGLMSRLVGEIATIKTVTVDSVTGKPCYFLEEFPARWDERGLELAPEKFYVKAKSKKRLDKILKKAEELGYKWGSGHMPTKWKPHWFHGRYPYLITFHQDKRIYLVERDDIGYFVEHDTCEKVKYKDFIADTEEEPKLLNTKIIFTKGDSAFKTGHIYEIKDGMIISDLYHKCPSMPRKPFETLDDVKDYFTAWENRKVQPGWSHETLKFIEVIE